MTFKWSKDDDDGNVFEILIVNRKLPNVFIVNRMRWNYLWSTEGLGKVFKVFNS